jgi:hypothetical protein
MNFFIVPPPLARFSFVGAAPIMLAAAHSTQSDTLLLGRRAA